MAPLCPTCAIEHRTVESYPNTVVECPFYARRRVDVTVCDEFEPAKPTREKRLEDALRELCEALDGTTTDGGIRVHIAIERACELIPRKP